MVQTAACPDVSTLKKLAVADLPPAEMEVLLGHLDGCAACLAKLPALAAADTLVDAIRNTKTLSNSADDPLLSGLIERLIKLDKRAHPARPRNRSHSLAPTAAKTSRSRRNWPAKKSSVPAAAKPSWCRPNLRRLRQPARASPAWILAVK